MTNKEALKMALQALEERMEDSYEGSERQEPKVALWLTEQMKAVKTLSALLN